MAIEIPAADDRPAGALRTFFLVGAPRCGTTFLAKVLARHPEVCFSKPKETFYFMRAPGDRPVEETRREFVKRYFRHLGPEHRILGEGSPMHLYATELIERLLAFDPETRLIASVRNPLEMAPSYHGRLLYTLDEDVASFDEAWALQGVRARGGRIPRRCRDPRLLQYQQACSLGRQVEALFKVAGRERCHVVVFDDLARDPERVYRELVAFLDIDATAPPQFATRRPHQEVRNRWVQRFVANPPPAIVGWVEAWERLGLGWPPWLRAVKRRLKRYNTRKAERPPLSEAMRARLREVLAADVDLLSSLLGRDLGHWLGADLDERPPSAAPG